MRLTSSTREHDKGCIDVTIETRRGMPKLKQKLKHMSIGKMISFKDYLLRAKHRAVNY